MLSGETIFKCKRFSSLQYVDLHCFCLKSFSLSSTEGARVRGQLHVQEQHDCPANKIASLLQA